MRRLLIVALAILFIGCGVAVGAGVYLNQPEVVARNAITGVVDDLLKRDEIKPLVNMIEKGSLELSGSMDAEKMTSVFGEEASGTASFGVKYYFAKDSLYMQGLHARINVPDEDIDLNFSADAFFSADYSYVTNDSVLDGTYGIIRGEMLKAFEDSIFADELNEELKTAITDLLEFYDDEKATEDFVKDAEDIVERYIKLLVKSISKHAEYESDSKNVKLGGEKINSRVITVTINGETIAAVMADLHKELEDDDDLRDFFKEYEKYYQSLAEEYGSDDILEVYDELVEQLGNLVEEMEDTDADGAIVLEIVTPKLTSTLRKLTVSMESDDYEEVLFVLDLGKDGIKKTERIALSIGEEGDDTYIFEITENSSKEYAASLKNTYKTQEWDEETYELKDVTKTQTLGSITIDKKGETFKLKIGEDEFEVKGSWVTKSKTTTITATKITADGTTVSKGFEIKLVISEKDSMPDPVKKEDVTNVLNLTMEDIEAIVERAEETFGMFGAEEAPPAHPEVYPY